MASQRTRRRSRKARSSRAGAVTASGQGAGQKAVRAAAAAPDGARVQPRVAPARTQTRRQQREERERRAARESAMAGRSLGTYGERPESIFHPVPVSEVAIFAGLVSVIVGLINQGGPALWVGAGVCGLGVLEFTAREHFSGYRSHATLLSAFPAIVVEIVLALFVGVPRVRILLLAPVVPVFALSFWLLTRSFKQARHARATRPPVA